MLGLAGPLTALVSVNLPTCEEDLVETWSRNQAGLLMELLSVKSPTASREQEAARLLTVSRSSTQQPTEIVELVLAECQRVFPFSSTESKNPMALDSRGTVFSAL